MQSSSEKFFCFIQKVIPQHYLSRFIARFAEAQTPWLKNALIHQAIRTYGIDLSIAERELPEQYFNFNDFFTRALKPGERPLCVEPNALLSPADGVLSQAGDIHQGRCIQAKGQAYTTSRLLGDDALAASFAEGSFATVYLSPKDYHRVHMPCRGKLLETRYIPGKLFSVNAATTRGIPDLFARNERLVCLFETECGLMTLVLVGAMLVAGIESTWQGAYPAEQHAVMSYADQGIYLEKGAEMGRFKFGSTVVVLLSKRQVFTAPMGGAVLMGEGLAFPS